MDHHTIRDEIIDFVQNSPEEANSKVAVFIAGMQAQKRLKDCRQRITHDLHHKNRLGEKVGSDRKIDL